MVDSGKEYVLQWTGHAAHVTERFAGLLARQALVDVTLICQGQKLRVHKLVLASCSLYFEEMLEQDLGQEPTILLRDLDFDVLKAMVEFMYCGETTISHCHLQTLSDAAHVFKVKELECIVKSMIQTDDTVEDVSSDPEDSEGIISSSSDLSESLSNKRSSRKRNHDSTTSSEIESDVTSECNDDRTLENVGKNRYDDNDDSLYEPTALTNEIPNDRSSNDRQSVKNISETLNSSVSKTFQICNSNEIEKSSVDSENSISTATNDSESIFVERSCNYSDDPTSINEISHFPNVNNSCTDDSDTRDPPTVVGECSKVYTHKKRKYTDRYDLCRENFVDSLLEISNVDENYVDDENSKIFIDANKIDKSLKVYSHKRRKSLDDEKKDSTKNNFTNCPKRAASTSLIDLSNDFTRDDQPATMSTTIDMETSEYVWTMSSETIQQVVGCTINSRKISNDVENETKSIDDETIDDQRTNENVDDRSTIVETSKSSSTNHDENVEVPVLRRSVRINQLENDDNVDNNGNTTIFSTTSKTRDKNVCLRNDDYSCNGSTNGRTKRRNNRDADNRVSDENNVTTTQQQQQQSCLRKTSNNSRSLRSASKITSDRTKVRGRCNLTRNYRYEQKSRNNVRTKKLENTDCDVALPTRLNTIASVDRALWGDMSDVLDNRDSGISKIVDHSPSKEIPFALGLLPLRAALERMQATLDHQPRKTRSSVAPMRHEINGFRRKDGDGNAATRKNVGNETNVVTSANTVCHIQIRTSSETLENHRNTNDEEICQVGSRSETNTR